MAADMAPEIAAEVQARDRERWLSALWAPPEARNAILALHAYDLEQQKIVAEARDPMLAEIRLAWWREQMEKLSFGNPAPPQPLLRALGRHAYGRAVDLAAFSSIEEAFLPLLTEGGLDALTMAAARGGPLFRALLTAILGRPLTNIEAGRASLSGTRWALAKLWRAEWGGAETRLQAMIPPAFPEAPEKALLPPSLKVLDRLAEDDWNRLEKGRPLARPASAGRQWKMLRAALGW